MAEVFVCEKCGTPVSDAASPLVHVRRCAPCARKVAAAELEAAIRVSRFRREALQRLELFQRSWADEKAAPARDDGTGSSSSTVAAIRAGLGRALARSLSNG